jgi:actin related protein 2/3 complex subunit 2
MDFVDFDGVSYHLATLDNQDTKIFLSIRWKCWPELIQYGAMDTLRREYSQWIVDPEPNYDFTLQFDVENLGADPGTSTACSRHEGFTQEDGH